MLEYTEIFSIIMGLLLMGLFGHKWSSDVLYQATSSNGQYFPYKYLIGFLLGLLLCFLPKLEAAFDHKREPVKKPPTYLLFLDSKVIKDENLRINNKALAILNNFLDKTNAKIIITSDDRINFTTQINWPIGTLKALYKARGIKGTIIGSIPYTKHTLTRQQEINLWYNITKMEYDGCVILDETSDSTNKMGCTVKVKNLLTKQHIVAIMNKLKVAPNPGIFKEKAQTYEEQFKTRFG